MKKKNIGSMLVLSGLYLTVLVGCGPAPVEYEAPKINASESGLSFDSENEDKVIYKVDNGEWEKGTSVAYSKEVGTHTVTTKVDVEGTKNTSKEETYTYETKALSLSDITVEGATATWTSVAKTTSLKVGDEEYKVVKEMSYTTAKTTMIKVKAEGGYDLDAKVNYVGEVIEKEAELVVTLKLDAPVFSVNDEATGLVLSDVENGTVKYSIDEGEWTDYSTLIPFETALGEHVVKAKAVGDGKYYGESEEVSYSYSTVEVELNVNKDSATHASWSTNVTNLRLNDVLTTQKEYTATTSETIKLVAESEYDSEAKVYKANTKTKSVTFSVNGNSYIVENANGKGTADLQDEWNAKKYDNGWVNTNASITAAMGENNTECMVLNSWNNGTQFRFEKAISIKDAYNALKFSIKGDNISTIKIRLLNSDSGIYATYDLGVVTNNWNDYVVSMEDQNWLVNVGGKDYPLSQVIGLVGKAEIGEAVTLFDKFEILQKGQTQNGNTTKLYLDDIRFENDTNPKSGYTAHITDIKTVYVTTLSNGLAIKLTLTSVTAGTIETLNYVDINTSASSEISSAVTVTIDNDDLSIIDPVNGAMLKLTCKVTDSGRGFIVKTGEGQVGTLLTGAKFAYAANIHMDFEDETAGTDYVNDMWTVSRYINSWEDVSSHQMRVRTENGNSSNKVVNMYSGGNTSYKYTYNVNGKIGSLGLMNFFSVDLGNWSSGAASINMKISVLTMDNYQRYLMGDANTWHSIPVNTKLENFSVFIGEPIEVKSISFTIRSALSSAYLYLDNILCDYRTKAPHTEHVDADHDGHCDECGTDVEVNHVDADNDGVCDVCGATIEVVTPVTNYANTNLDFENLTAGTDYTGTDWTREKYTSSWVTGGTMRVRKNPENTTNVMNLSNGYSMTYNYTYVGDGTGLGVANHFAIKLGNWFSGAQAMNIKISILDTSGTKHYLVGDASNFYSFPVTTTLTQLEQTLTSDIDVKSVCITTKSSMNGNAYLYMDDIVINHI